MFSARAVVGTSECVGPGGSNRVPQSFTPEWLSMPAALQWVSRYHRHRTAPQHQGHRSRWCTAGEHALLRLCLSGVAPVATVAHASNHVEWRRRPMRARRRVHSGLHRGTPHVSEASHRTAARPASALRGAAPAEHYITPSYHCSAGIQLHTRSSTLCY